MKSSLKFISVLIVLLLVYCIFVTNIDKFTTSYNDKIQEHENSYYMYRNTVSVLDAIKTYDIQEITTDNIYSIKNNNIVRNILEQYGGIDEFYDYIDKVIQDKEMVKIKNDNGTIIYLQQKEFELAFCLETKDIIYKETMQYEENLYNVSYKEITDENKELIYNKSKQDMELLGITKEYEFEPETIYTSYYAEQEYGIEQDKYIIEDNTNHIKIEYSSADKKIVTLQIGFDKYISIA